MSGPAALAAPDAVALVQSSGPVPSAQDKTMEAARQFEGLLMGMLFQSMRKTIEPSGLFGGSETTRSTYDYLLDQAVADKAASSGQGWGLAKILAASWSQARAASGARAK